MTVLYYIINVAFSVFVTYCRLQNRAYANWTQMNCTHIMIPEKWILASIVVSHSRIFSLLSFPIVRFRPSRVFRFRVISRPLLTSSRSVFTRGD